MSHEELAFFITSPGRSWPFYYSETTDQDDRFYGRRITNVTFSDDDNSLLSFEYTGETAAILGDQFTSQLIVLCGRVNHQWYSIMPAYHIATAQVIISGEYKGGEQQRSGTQFIYPESVELITTGDYKSELDGLYSVIPRYNGQGQRSDCVSHYCVGTDLARKPGASMVLEAEPAIVEGFSTGNYKYTLTVTHPGIDTTVYQSLTTGGGPLTQLFKFVGDSSLPEDVWWRPISVPGMMPLWFDLESDDETITGLYTLWCGYYVESSFSWSTINKGYIHDPTGVRRPLVYNGQFFTTYFRIQIGVPSGGAIRYNCQVADWSNQNGDRFTFTLDTNTSTASAPDTIEVRRPATGFCRTPRREDQLQ